jgi:hypothetical protein
MKNHVKMTINEAKGDNLFFMKNGTYTRTKLPEITISSMNGNSSDKKYEWNIVKFSKELKTYDSLNIVNRISGRQF